MKRIELDFENSTYEAFTVETLDGLMLHTHEAIHLITRDIMELSKITEAEWDGISDSITDIPRRLDLIRVKETELDREYEKYDTLEKLLALKDIGVL